jgi:hypothetical protein
MTIPQVFFARREDNVTKPVGQSARKPFQGHEKTAIPVIPDLGCWDTVLLPHMFSTVSLDAAHVTSLPTGFHRP